MKHSRLNIPQEQLKPVLPAHGIVRAANQPTDAKRGIYNRDSQMQRVLCENHVPVHGVVRNPSATGEINVDRQKLAQVRKRTQAQRECIRKLWAWESKYPPKQISID